MEPTTEPTYDPTPGLSENGLPGSGPVPGGRTSGGRTPSGLTGDALRREIADVLGEDPEEITDDENLFDLGLDSVRLMALVRRWRALGADVAFEDLAERPFLSHWRTVLGGAR